LHPGANPIKLKRCKLRKVKISWITLFIKNILQFLTKKTAFTNAKVDVIYEKMTFIGLAPEIYL
jgi:hypothetical protein